MARQVTKKRKQVVLKRDENGKVIYDSAGRPVVEKTIKKSRNSKRKFADEVPQSGPVTVRQMTPEEMEYYSKRTRSRKCGVPPV